MIAFWLAAAALTLVALALLLPPLLRRPGDRRRDIERELARTRVEHEAGRLDEATWASERQRLGAALADAVSARTPAPERGLAVVLAVIIPVAAVLLYLSLGRPDALAPAGTSVATGTQPVDMASAVAGLEERLRAEPDQVEGWLLLARSYRAMERFDDMQRATTSAMALAPQMPEVLVEHAEAITLNGPDRRFQAPARRLLEQALAIDPRQQKALWLLGIAELQAQRPAEAIQWWQRLRTLLADDDPVAARVDEQIASARAQLGDAGVPAAGNAGGASLPSPTDGDGDAAGPRLLVTVTLGASLPAPVPDRATLFVFVRSPDGGPPLAIRRVDMPALPATVALGPADRMLEGVQMRTGAEVLVGARLSASGQAQPQPGDLEAEPARLTLADSGTIELVIDRIVE